MKANEVQVGGSHYKTSYEHWDLVHNTGMGYFEGQITRYVSRWRKKDGVQDLQKAIHYIDKRIELGALERTPPSARALTEVANFSAANGLIDAERVVIEDIVLWTYLSDLIRAKSTILGQLMPQEPKPVPLTEENHHAERANSPCDDEAKDTMGW